MTSIFYHLPAKIVQVSAGMPINTIPNYHSVAETLRSLLEKPIHLFKCEKIIWSRALREHKGKFRRASFRHPVLYLQRLLNVSSLFFFGSAGSYCAALWWWTGSRACSVIHKKKQNWQRSSHQHPGQFNGTWARETSQEHICSVWVCPRPLCVNLARCQTATTLLSRSHSAGQGRKGDEKAPGLGWWEVAHQLQSQVKQNELVEDWFNLLPTKNRVRR